MEKLNKIIFVSIFFLITIVVPFFTFTRNFDRYTFFENRMVAEFPEYSKDDFMSGKYFNDIESYFSDIIIMRNTALKFNVIYDKIFMNKNVINNVLVLDNVLLPYNKYGTFFTHMVNKYVDDITIDLKKLTNELKDRGIEFYYIGIPEQMSYYSDKYPGTYNSGREHFDKINEIMKSKFEEKDINFISIKDYYNELENIKYNLYYKTDHHYTAYGAYKAYEAIIENINKDLNINLDIYKEDEIEFRK